MPWKKLYLSCNEAAVVVLKLNATKLLIQFMYIGEKVQDDLQQCSSCLQQWLGELSNETLDFDLNTLLSKRSEIKQINYLTYLLQLIRNAFMSKTTFCSQRTSLVTRC